jgi:hypothetical protein
VLTQIGAANAFDDLTPRRDLELEPHLAQGQWKRDDGGEEQEEQRASAGKGETPATPEMRSEPDHERRVHQYLEQPEVGVPVLAVEQRGNEIEQHQAVRRREQQADPEEEHHRARGDQLRDLKCGSGHAETAGKETDDGDPREEREGIPSHGSGRLHAAGRRQNANVNPKCRSSATTPLASSDTARASSSAT